MGHRRAAQALDLMPFEVHEQALRADENPTGGVDLVEPGEVQRAVRQISVTVGRRQEPFTHRDRLRHVHTQPSHRAVIAAEEPGFQAGGQLYDRAALVLRQPRADGVVEGLGAHRHPRSDRPK